MATTGMFSGIFAPQVDPAIAAEEERLRALAGMDPFKQAGYAALAAGAQAGRGLGNILGGLTGRDTRSAPEKRNAALEAAKAEIVALGANPKQQAMVDILRKHGLLGESFDVGSALTDQAATAERLRIQAEESARKKAKDITTDVRAKERNEILRKNGVPELIRMIEIVEEFDPLTQGPQRKLRLDALNAMLESKQKGIVLADAGGRIVPVSRATGLPMGEAIEVTEKPLSAKDAKKEEIAERGVANAYRNAIAKAQDDYDVVVRLHNHPGLPDITGRINRLVGEPGTFGQLMTTKASPEGRAALALWRQVTGGTFLSGLNVLKAASPTGSTGLGQTSNIEGDKVQNAMAALIREQDSPDLQLNLRVYLKKLADSVSNLNAAAQADGLDPVPLKEKPLTTGGQPGAAAKAPAAAPAEDTVKVKLPDGRIGNIPRANLEAAKAAGAVEVK